MSLSTEAIRACLQQALSPRELAIVDDSHLHVGHHGHGGGGHFSVRIVADVFAGKSLIERHRLVYQTLAHWMGREIHALKIDALV
jgi:BolA family transcriptional regulator, general stress-responsive regulator